MDWLDQQAQVLLPIPYFHLVFTLPHELNPLIQQNRARLYDRLFDTASATLLEFGQNHLHAQIGVTAVLHTWSQTLLDHYPLHGIVTGGGLRPDGGWQNASRYWLFPVRALAKVFRGKFRDGLRQLDAEGKLEFHGPLQSRAQPRPFEQGVQRACGKNRVVYAKRPFAGPETVLAYLSRYTPRVGITHRRLLALDAPAQTVTLAYKDYADPSRKKTLTLALSEFPRRFRLHLLPERFVKIRHYGLLANRHRHARIAQARAALPRRSRQVKPIPQRPAATATTWPIGPHCRQPALIPLRVTRAPKHAPPPYADSS